MRSLGAFVLGWFVVGCEIPDADRSPAPPRLIHFEFDPLEARPGEPVWLRWAIEGGVDTVDVGVGDNAPLRMDTSQGRLEVRAQAPLEAHLWASGPGGSVQARALLQVGLRRLVDISTFEVLPGRIRPGEPARISWEARDALAVSLSGRVPGRLDVVLFDDLPAVGARVLRPDASMNVVLRADGLGGPALREAVLEVGPPPPVIHAFRADPLEARPGRGIHLVWHVEGAQVLRIERLFPNGTAAARLVEWSSPGPEGTLAIEVEEGVQTFRLEAQSGGERRHAEASVRGVPSDAPRVEVLAARPMRTGWGGEVDVEWRVESADAASLTIGDRRTEPVGLSGAVRFEPDQVSTRIRLLATGGELSVVDEVQVEVDAQLPEISTFGVSPTRSAPGEPLTARWRTRSADLVRIEDDTGRIALGPFGAEGFAVVRPEGPVALSLIAENNVGSTRRTLSLRVGPRPAILRFEALDPVVRAERPVRWAYRIESAETVLLSMPGRAPVLLTDNEGILSRRRSIVEATPEGRLQASSPLFSTTATAGFLRLPGAFGPEETEPNDSLAVAHEAVIPGSFSALTAAGDVDVLILEAPLGRRIRLVHGGGPSLQLTAVPLDSEHGALGWQEVFPALAPGQSLEARLARLAPFALSVETSSLAGAYRLDVDVPLTVCGDGVADENEDCDDGNLTSGDGCSAACAREDSDETEPNDEALRADVLSLSPAQGFLRRNEEDWFVFDVGPAQVGAWSFLASDADGLGCSVDLRLSLVDANGREVMVDDGGGLGCPDLLGPATFLNLGTWYVRVSPGTGRRLPPWGAYRLSSSAPP